MPTILYVDDEPLLRRMVKAQLPRLGFAVRTASSLRSARRCLVEHAVDGVFIDIWLGDENGFALFAWIQQHRPALARRVAFITGDIDPDAAQEESLSALGRPVLPKPFTAQDLARHAHAWFAGDRAAGQGEAAPGRP